MKNQNLRLKLQKSRAIDHRMAGGLAFTAKGEKARARNISIVAGEIMDARAKHACPRFRKANQCGQRLRLRARFNHRAVSAVCLFVAGFDEIGHQIGKGFTDFGFLRSDRTRRCFRKDSPAAKSADIRPIWFQRVESRSGGK